MQASKSPGIKGAGQFLTIYITRIKGSDQPCTTIEVFPLTPNSASYFSKDITIIIDFLSDSNCPIVTTDYTRFEPMAPMSKPILRQLAGLQRACDAHTTGCCFGTSAEYLQRRLLHWCTVVLLVIGLSACSEPPYTNVDNARLQSMLEQDIPIYDVRRPDEWRQTGVVEGSKLLTFVDANGRVRPDFLASFTAAADKHDPVILICRTGSRTAKLARHLVEDMGYTQVFNVRRGITRWISDDRPVKRL